MGARPAPAPGGIPGRWGLTTAVPAPAGAAVAASAALLEEIAAALADVWGEPVGLLGLGHACPACGGTDHGAPSLTGLPPGRGALVSFTHVVLPVTGRVRVGAWWAAARPATPRLGLHLPSRGHRALRRLINGDAKPGAGLGLDLERVDAPAFAVPARLGAVAFSPGERAWLARHEAGARPAARARLWTRKEAIVKATGTGFRADPSEVEALDPAPGMRVVELRQYAAHHVVGALSFLSPDVSAADVATTVVSGRLSP